MKQTILVTGGAGYIGSHTVKKLLERGDRRVVVLDDLSTGHRESLEKLSPLYLGNLFFEEIDLRDKVALESSIDKYDICGVIDFTGSIEVGESQKNPGKYLHNNVLAFVNLLTVTEGIPIVKSSTAATYGNPLDLADMPLNEDYQETVVRKKLFVTSQLMSAEWDFDRILEWYAQNISGDQAELEFSKQDIETLKIPTNVYGITKMMDEIILSQRSGKSPYVALRYFNAAGADESGIIGEDHSPESHLIPITLQVALGKRDSITIFGEDYPTSDGTAVRDYVHVNDLTEAHIRAIDYLLKGGQSDVFNLGTGQGNSVREIVDIVRDVTGQSIPVQIGSRRIGDPAVLVADADKVKNKLGWKPQKNLYDCIETAWKWHSSNPSGYRT